MIAKWMGAACLILIAGCATSPITGRQQLMLVPESEVIQASEQAYAQEMAEARRKGQLDTDPRTVSWVRGIADRIIRQAVRYRPESANWRWQVNVVSNPQVNAYAMAGGKIAVYTGLLDKVAPTDDQLAQVLAHEIGHALAGHSQEKMSLSLGTDLVLSAVSAADPRTRQALSAAALLAVQLPYSRQMESEADRIGIELAARAGYDPRAAVTLWQKMSREEGGGVPEFLSTHPSDAARIDALSRLVPQMMPLYEAARR